MDLVPTPDQLVAAVGTLGRRALRGGVADLRPMPSIALGERGDGPTVLHYRPESTHPEGDPVLLVPPLAASTRCYDLRRGGSLVEHLVATRRPTYALEPGEIDFHDRDLSLQPWVDTVVPAAIREVSEHAGGRPVHLVGWSLGGLLALLCAADADLPIASVSLLGTPVDLDRVPLVAPLRPLVDPTQGSSALVRRTSKVLRATIPLAPWAIAQPLFHAFVTRPFALTCRVDDPEFWAQVQAVERLQREMPAYRGRTYGQLYHRFAGASGLASGSIEVADRTIELGDVSVPVLVVAGAIDQIAPVDAVKAVVPLLAPSEEVRFEIVPGGHLGLLTGREARTTTWPALDDWLTRWASPEQDLSGDPDAGRSRDTIGASRKRRYGSGGSRSLAP